MFFVRRQRWIKKSLVKTHFESFHKGLFGDTPGMDESLAGKRPYFTPCFHRQHSSGHTIHEVICLLIPGFAKALNRHMQEHGLTDRELAGRVGVTERLITMMREGETRPSQGVLIQLCEVFGETPNQFLSK